MKRKAYVRLISAILFTPCFLPILSSIANANVTEDIIVDDDQTLTIENTTFSVNGSIIVKDRGSLVIRNSTFRSIDMLKAYDESNILIVDSKIEGPGDFGLRFAGNATVDISSSILENGWIGVSDRPAIRFSNSKVSGLSISGYATGADILVQNSFVKFSYILGIASLVIKDSEYCVEPPGGFKLSFGSMAYPEQVNATLTLKPGFIPYWNLYNNGSVSGRPYNVTIINSRVGKWSVDLYSDFSSVTLIDSNLEALRTFYGASANIYNSVIEGVNVASGSLRAYNSSLLWLEPSTYSSVVIRESDVGILFSFSDKHSINLHDLRPGHEDYLRLNEVVSGADYDVTIVDSDISWSLFLHHSNITLKDCYISKTALYVPRNIIGPDIREGSELRILGNSNIEDGSLRDNSTIIRQCLFEVKFSDKRVQGAEIRVYRGNSSLLKTTTNAAGEALASLVLNKENYTFFRSTYKAEVESRISDVSRGYATIEFNMETKQPISAELGVQHWLNVISSKGSPIGTGWYDRNSATTASANYVTDAITGEERYILVSYTLDGKMTNVSRTGTGFCSINITMDAPHTLTINYIPQYYLTVKSEYGNPQGEGWYDAGVTATFSVTSPLGTGIQQVFTGWSGNSTATECTADVVMVGPKAVTADWRTDYTQLYAIIGIVVAVVSVTILATMKRRKTTLEDNYGHP